jgi:SAM-dependent methyltransferase
MTNSEELFSRKILRINRDKAASYLSEKASNNWLFRDSGEDIIERLACLKREFPKILEIGCRTGELTNRLRVLYPRSKIIQTDISVNMLLNRNNSEEAIQLDEERPSFAPESFDLIVSNLNLHWINDLPRFLNEIRGILKKDGLFIANVIGERSLYSLRKILFNCEKQDNNHSMRVIPMLKFESLAGLLQTTGFSMPVVDKDEFNYEFATLYEFLKELRYLGESNNLSLEKRGYLSKRAYKNILSHDKFIAAFDILTLTGAK